MYDLECPYCDAQLDVCHDDGFGYEEGKPHEMDCSECGKNFVFHTSIHFHYSPEKADCLNGSPHAFTNWRKMYYNNKGEETQQRRCMACDHTERRSIPATNSAPTVV